MRQSMVAGNWKMNGTCAEASALVDGIVKGIGKAQVQIVLCPPFVHLQLVAQKLRGIDGLDCGAQNLDPHASGAYTGEISGPMLADVGCRYVIVGHSERRIMFAESSEVVMHKCRAVQEIGLIPILCVGETLAQRESGQTEKAIQEQLDTVLSALGVEAFQHIVVAYEPVWAIGTGRTATPDQAQEVHQFVRASIAAKDTGVAAQVQILYGGSVKSANAHALFSMPDIDGGLIGGASLDSAEFLAICEAAKPH
ncbi:MAG: triose-phosphate isomerase [Gammaproteobacteria bacterium]|nr:triose-phosphate isomerase [Gammaproteobacteria bacterium]